MRIYLLERGRRLNVNDLWIAAIAAANGLPIVTQDADFSALDGYPGLFVRFDHRLASAFQVRNRRPAGRASAGGAILAAEIDRARCFP